jgi:hypothetical protein
MVLGTLTKSAINANLWPTPPAPYGGHSFLTVIRETRNLQIQGLCGLPSPKGYPYVHYDDYGGYEKKGRSCNKVKGALTTKLDVIENELSGLSLEEFKITETTSKKSKESCA